MIWDSFDSFVNEYIRSCAHIDYQRQDLQIFYFCHDNQHPGFGVTFSFAKHLLKHVCSSSE